VEIEDLCERICTKNTVFGPKSRYVLPIELGDAEWTLHSSMMQYLEESGSRQPYVTTEHVNQVDQQEQETRDRIEVQK
jgi:hypothetical protein